MHSSAISSSSSAAAAAADAGPLRRLSRRNPTSLDPQSLSFPSGLFPFRLSVNALSYSSSSPRPLSLISLAPRPLRAISDSDGVGETEAAPRRLLRTLQLGILFGLWYLFNIYFNIYDKQVRPPSLFFSFFVSSDIELCFIGFLGLNSNILIQVCIFMLVLSF